MIWLAYITLVPLLVALAFCIGAKIHEEHPRLAAWTIWRSMIGWRRWAVAAVLLAWTLTGADKGGPAPLEQIARMVYLTVMANGEMRGPTNVIASATAAWAVEAVAAQSSNMVAAASNNLAWAEGEIDLLEPAVTNASFGWITGDIPQDMSGGKPVARCDLLGAVTRTNGVIDAYVQFNVVPDTAPIVDFEAGVDDGIYYAFPAVSNSFPRVYLIVTPSGVASGYVYTVSTPDALRGVTLIPERGMTFGGGSQNKPLSVLGAVMVDDRIGVTAERSLATGVIGVFEGGVLVEVK